MCKISLTYDGGTPDHLETVCPALESRGLRGTFYIDPTCLLDEIDTWRGVSNRGHEVGNGSLLTDCLPDGSFPAWTKEMIYDEVTSSQDLFCDLLENNIRSVGLPIGNRECADSSDYLKELPHDWVYRTGDIGPNLLGDPNLKIKCLPIVGLTSKQITQVVEQCISPESWLVLSFVGIGSGERSIDSSAHNDLLDLIGEIEAEVQPIVIAARAQMGDRPAFHVL